MSDLFDDDTDRLVAEMDTVEQALAYLEVPAGTDDHFILSVAPVKAKEDDLSAKLVRRALELIGTARNSDVLLAEARSSSDGSQMTPSQAYALLGIDHPEQIDDDIIVTAHALKLEDAPHRASEINEAMALIAEARQSEHLRVIIASQSGNAVHLGSVGNYSRIEMPITEPRGLNNIGNTCYLNSLLQYLFTIKPIRDMVEHFDEYKHELPEASAAFEKKVADMKVDRAGVEHSQACESKL